MTGPVTSLSAIAANQIICTVAGTAPQVAAPSTYQGGPVPAVVGPVDIFAPVTLAGPDGVRPPRSCPIK